MADRVCVVRRGLVCLVLAAFWCVGAAPAVAQPPFMTNPQSSTTRLIPMSGVLTQPDGRPLSGSVVLLFGLYDAEEDGTLLWTETQQVQSNEHGRYSAYLGASTPLPQDAFSKEQARWLSVEVGGRQLPRTMLVAVPYALRAADADTLGGKPLSSFVLAGVDGRMQASAGVAAEALVDGSGTPGQIAKFTTATEVGNSILTESTSRLGIGTSDPTEAGQIDSKVTIRTADGSTALAVSNQSGTPRFALNINSDGSWITYDRATGVYQPGIAQRGGRVGVATTDPTGGGAVDAKFTVRNLDNNTGIAVLNQTNARRFALNTLSTGAWLLYDGGSGIWNPGLSQVNGNIGIGTTAPTAKVQITASTIDGLWSAQNTAPRHAIRGTGRSGSVAVVGIASDSVVDLSGPTVGVLGFSDVTGAAGVQGSSGSGTGIGVVGITVNGTAIQGQSSGTGLAGNFLGNVTVTGTLSKGGGAFKIDHPLDPMNKYLLHSFVESPDMMNVYNGNVTLDANGEAWVTLPDWFEALNRDFRYQLTAIGAPGPNLYVASEVSGNRFRIAGGTATGRVSWQVTGIRQDAWATAHRISVEEDKPSVERGRYLHPSAYGQPPQQH